MLCIVASLFMVLAGCDGGVMYIYEPRPFSADLLPPDTAAPPVRTLASVAVVSDGERGPAVVARLRFESEQGSPAVTFDPASLTLHGAGLERFPDPEVLPSGPITIEPGRSATVTARFPFPGGEAPGPFDLSGLNLRWALGFGEQTVSRSVTFTRTRPPHYYRSYPYHPYTHFHFGHRFHHHW